MDEPAPALRMVTWVGRGSMGVAHGIADRCVSWSVGRMLFLADLKSHTETEIYSQMNHGSESRRTCARGKFQLAAI